jgi:phage terminase large subunit GpA-like protein
VHWTKTDDKHYPETAKLVCSACKHEWTEQERRDAIARKGGIRWRQTREFLCCGEEQKPEQWEWDEDNQIDRARCKHCNAKAVNNQHAGFHISKLCAPQISIVEIAQRFIAAKHSSEEETATFYNTVLGEAYKASSAKIVAPNILAARAEDYATEVPKDVVLLTFASDVQYGGSANEGRFEVEVVGWGLGDESWSIAHEVLHGNPQHPDSWLRLDAILDRPFKHELGFEMFVMGGCIDSGGSSNPQEVHQFCRSRNNLWAIKGRSERGGTWGPIWPPRKKVKKWRGGNDAPVMVGVNTGKRWVQRRLEIESPGPGYCHFPRGRPVAYFEQFSAEEEITENRAGSLIRRFRQIPGRANEALDLRVYNVAALLALREERGITVESLHAKMMDHLERKKG